MLNRAKRFWREALEAKGMQDNKERLKDQWLQVGATSFAKEIGSGGADLVIFAAGGICHVTKDEEVLEFLKNVHAGLKKGGKAIISVLRDLITQEHGTKGGTEEASDSFESLESASAKGAKAQHIPSIDKPGEIYVKHPTTGDWKGNIKTERFRLDIEDEAGKLLRSHELEWDERVLDKDGWVRMVTGAGLRVKQVIDGEIQIWYILEKAYG
ncbi:hypothetical protein K469DRAFT_712547 [Zopfia rhizophila CBS 207.26]|uniref:Methyltransferase type 11 domain-containing protein n=1 Tax=Zopfia rhizophila CBS 207.26 TaxID=1314779 RepID=A0A6A6ESN8_9PEZI|nr:hypothetical protein K469DRAFT_712547 [Zopfia rhizophila CBS 207.26]